MATPGSTDPMEHTSWMMTHMVSVGRDMLQKKKQLFDFLFFFCRRTDMADEWQVVSSRRPVRVQVYKEKATGIHYVVFKKELEMSRGDDCIWARAVVEFSPSHFVFVDGHYSSEGDLSVKNFSKRYSFMRTLDLYKINTESFAEDDPRLVSCVYSVSIQFQ